MKRDSKGRFVGGQKIRVPFTCKYCGKKKLVMPHEVKERVYCSQKCSGKGTPNLINNLPIKYRIKKERATQKCGWCGNRFTHLITKSRTYCSNKCYHDYKASKRPVFTCEVCSKKYTPKDRHTSRQLNASFRTCSNECKGKRRRTGKDINCKHCGKKFYVTNPLTKFCSQKCSNAGRRRVKGKEHPKWVDKQKFNCDVCGKAIEFSPRQVNTRKKHKTKKIYCSIACKNVGHSHLMTGIGNTRWLGGISFEPYSRDWTKALKKKIRQRDNYTCQFCGKKETSKGLDVHHINYNKKDCNPENLICLCHSCHAKTNAKREEWKKIFKEIRKGLK